jgi:hypothetical protein
MVEIPKMEKENPMVEAEIADGLARQRRVMAGAGLFICTKTFRWAGELFRKDITRIAPEWFHEGRRVELLRFFRPLDGARSEYLSLTRPRRQSRTGSLPAPVIRGGEAWRL